MQFFKRSLATGLALLTLITSTPAYPVFALEAPQVIPVKTGPTTVKIFEPLLNFTAQPVDDEIVSARVFQERLTPIASKSALLDENKTLAIALKSFRSSHNDIREIVNFLSAFPNSRWRPSLELNLGKLQFERGYFSQALDLYRSAWEGSKDEPGRDGETLANDALSEYVLLCARLGKTSEVEKYLQIAKSRDMFGPMEVRIAGARQGLAQMKTRPDCAYKCGPFALNRLVEKGLSKSKNAGNILAEAKSTARGTNLAQLQKLAEECGMKYQIAKRAIGAPLVVPAIVHWKVDHFAAITNRTGSKYRVQDSTFGTQSNFWVSMDCLDSESDGYFLVPAGPLPSGWETVSIAEGATVWGKGAGHEQAFGDNLPGGRDYCTLPPCGNCNGMPKASAWAMLATLHIVDVPLEYSPPYGPSMNFRLNYSHLEANQPTSDSFSNFGHDWNFNWVSYLTVDASGNVLLRPGQGGNELYEYSEPNNLTNPYPPNLLTQAILTRIGKTSYERKLPDGSKSIYDQPDGTGRIFMTKVFDPQGNAATISYNSNFRVNSVTDALGQVTTLGYSSNTLTDPRYYKIATLTDPFSPARAVSFGYDASNSRVISITDAIGLQSTFSYDSSSSFISSMTTPYGTSSFYAYTPTKGAVGTNPAEARGLRMVFPDKSSVVVENWAGPPLQTYYWDRHALDLYPTDTANCIYSHCQTTTWLVSRDGVLERAVPKSEKMPLESEIRYTYPDEGMFGTFRTVGSSNQPISVKRLLDNGHDQTSTFEYNAAGQMTKSVDPLDRTLSYFYSANLVDLLEIRETKGSNNFLQGKWRYNENHLPVSSVDSSGNDTQFSYLPTGQISTITDAKGNTTQFNYTGNYLTSIDGPLPGNRDVTTFAYDSYKRLASVTDSRGYQIQYQYDALNRPTKTIFPDGTFDENRYNRLDLVATIDRLGRLTETKYDEIQQPERVIDPLGREIRYTWCSCGSLVSIVDGAGNKTIWTHDLQGRVTAKTYADESSNTFIYEENTSRLKSRTDAMNQTTNYSYNDDDTLSSITYTNEVKPTSDVTLTWDQNYRRVSSIANDWGTLEYVYNPCITDPCAAATTGGGMIQKIRHLVGGIHDTTRDITYQYDELGRTTNRSINGSANSVTWAYDNMSRVTNEQNSLGTFQYSYVDQNAPGGDPGTTRLSKITYPNSQITAFNYLNNTGDQRLYQITNTNTSGGLLSQFKYGYNPSGEISEWQQIQNGNSAHYNLGYDDAGQLSSATAGPSKGKNSFTRNYQYNYDLAANRTSASSATVDCFRVSGSKTTGDTLTVTVYDSALEGGQKSVSYTVQANDTIYSITAGVAANITNDFNLQSIGIDANAVLDTVNIRSISINTTRYSTATSGGATVNFASTPQTDGTVNAKISGTKTTNDTVTVRVKDLGLSGGFLDVTYTVQSSDTLTTIAAGLGSLINARTELQALGISASWVSTIINIKSCSPNLTTFESSVSAGATETISLSTNVNPIQSVVISGTKTTSDSLKLTVYDASLIGASETITYSVQAGDTLTTIATNLTTAFNANSDLNSANIKATSNGTTISIRSPSNNWTSYSQTVSDGATESISLPVNTNPLTLVTLGGTKTAGDVLTLAFFDLAIPADGKESVSYTVLSTDTLTTIALGLKNAINGNADLQTAGIRAASSDNRIAIESRTLNDTVVRRSSNANATESILIAPKQVKTQTAVLRGYAFADAEVSLSVFDSQISGGTVTKTHTFTGADTLATAAAALAASINSDSGLREARITASSKDNVLYLTSTSIDMSTYTESKPEPPIASPTPQIWLASNLAITGFNHNNVNELIDTNSDGNLRFSGSSSKPIILDPLPPPETLELTSTVKSNTLRITSKQPNTTTYSVGTSSGATAIPELGYNSAGSTTVSIGGVITDGDVLSVGVHDTRLSGGVEAISYSIHSGDTLASVASGLAELIASNTDLQDIGISATCKHSLLGNWSQNFDASPTLTSAAQNNISVEGRTPGLPGAYKATLSSLKSIGMRIAATTSAGSTGDITLSSYINGSYRASIGLGFTAGDVVSLTFHNPLFKGGPIVVSRTVQPGDSSGSISAALISGINGNATLQSLEIKAGTFIGIIFITSGKQVHTDLTYDANGNLLTDGQNSYEWDAENRLIKITYPGSGNNSQITFDGVGRGAKIIEQSGGSTTSTKQLVWCGQSRCEERNGAGTVAKKFFQHGQTISGLSYFNSLDHLGSIRELTDSSGTIQAQYAFDPYGRVTKLQGSLSADFQYAGYYTHAQSGLNFTRTRAYNCTNGRWISRDPVNELGGINLYLYVYGNPINFLDPTGLGSNQCCIDWDKVRDAANWGTVGGAAIGGYIGSGAGAIGGGVAGGGVGAIPGSAAGTYGGAAAGAAIGGFGAGAASIAGQMAGNLMSSGSGSGSSGAGAGTNSGTIDCSPHPCDPPKFLSTFGECTRYCDNNCKAEHNAACRSKCLRRYGNSGGDRGGLPPVRQ